MIDNFRIKGLLSSCAAVCGWYFLYTLLRKYQHLQTDNDSKVEKLLRYIPVKPHHAMHAEQTYKIWDPRMAIMGAFSQMKLFTN
ncbi:hypothetical protein C8R32_10119 [Nitrosospira sp. Nsp5]|uniref:Transposase n=1 Tax=Nitrosospira multiformis TaxID=1231 RepID=A0ABY0TJ85_9PROT|nr:hypothetical protein C8R32_10119 [Nitrosospira sp. Nsp5]SDQ82545.1 hypothetical protein SAMN05216402_2444 [Nitrosospira multiformis]